MINSDIDPHQWANWLQEIRENPGHHKVIANDGYSVKFIDKEDASSEDILNATEILKISKSLLQRKDINLLDKYRILSGARHIISSREKKFQNLGFITAIFARLRGVGKEIRKEKEEIRNLQSGLHTEIDQNKLNYTKQLLDHFEHRKLTGNLTATQKTLLNEKLFQCGKELYQLKQSAAEGETHQIEELEKQLHKINPHLPEISSLVEAFGPEALKDTLKETVSSLCEHHPVDRQDFERDCHLFSCSPTEMQAIYVRRMVKAQQTGFSLSTVSAIEKTWQELLLSKQEQAVERTIGEHRVVFIPNPLKGGIYVKEKLIGQGGFKAAFLASSFLSLKKASDRKEMVILQPLAAVREEIAEANRQKEEAARKLKEQERIAAIAESIEPPSPSARAGGTTFAPGERGPTGTEVRITQPAPDEATGTVVQTPLPTPNEATGTVVQTPPPASEEATGTLVHNPPPTSDEATGTVVQTPLPTSDEATGTEVRIPISGVKAPAPHIPSPAGGILPPSAKPFEEVEEHETSPIAVPEWDEREAYRKEAQMCLEVGHLPGVWPTHKVTDINGEIAIIQKAAGYTVKPLRPMGSEKEMRVIDLDKMAKLAADKQLNPQDQKAFLNMIGDFLKGVQSLHRRGIIHRDLKPENVLCSPSGQGGITDFGISCYDLVLHEEGERLIPNPNKQIFSGTSAYLPPETAILDTEAGVSHSKSAWKNIGTRSDIWSCGIILWELFSGESPTTHPAINLPLPSNLAHTRAAALLNRDVADAREEYHARFPEPNNKDSLLHLIWKCTRENPAERVDIDAVIERYERWSEQVKEKLEQGEITSVVEAFATELNMESAARPPETSV